MKEKEKLLLTETEAAQLLGLSKKTLQARRHNSLLPVYYKLGRSVRYRIEDLLDWMEENKKDVGK